jgi:hypothetical protein
MSRGPFHDYRIGDDILVWPEPLPRRVRLTDELMFEVEWGSPDDFRERRQYALERLAQELLARGLVGHPPSVRVIVRSPGTICARILAYKESE